jgi:uncharacterized protein YndB with AHSA1/START domain
MTVQIPHVIRKDIILKAPLDKVWAAISDASQFGQWFGMRFDAPAFVANTPVTGHIVPTMVDPEVAASQKPYEGTPVAFSVGEIQPKHLFQLRWHPYAIDKDVDYSSEPMTLITFALKEVEGGVHLTLTESGFENIPLERRTKAFEANSGGWSAQMRLIEAYLQGAGRAR